MDECAFIDEIDACVDDFCVKQLESKVESYSYLHEGNDLFDETAWFDSLQEDDAPNFLSRHAICSVKNEETIVYTGKERPEKEEGKNEVVNVELKELPSNLKYAFLGENNSFPVIIAVNLSCEQEDKLVQVLKEKNQAIGWSIHDIVGISPTMCMHRIELEENAKPARDFQRRLNLVKQEVVKKEVIKLLDEGIIYPIANSSWVSLVHVVPKKSGFTVQENEQGELVPVRKTTGWRMCIDYMKLNASTKKDHFPLPFID